jgi:hypothetical protein
MKKFMEKFIEAVRKYEELLAYAQGEFILPYHSGAGMIGYYYSPIPLVTGNARRQGIIFESPEN